MDGGEVEVERPGEVGSDSDDEPADEESELSPLQSSSPRAMSKELTKRVRMFSERTSKTIRTETRETLQVNTLFSLLPFLCFFAFD